MVRWYTLARRASSSLPAYKPSTATHIPTGHSTSTLTEVFAGRPDIIEHGDDVYILVPDNCEAVLVEKEAMEDFVDLQLDGLTFGGYQHGACD